MQLKYIFITCLTNFILTVNSINDKEIENLFNDIKLVDFTYITYANLIHYYNQNDVVEIQQLLKDYGYVFDYGKGVKEYRLDYLQFRRAALDGYIPLYFNREIADVFDKIRPKNKVYITHENMVKFYKGMKKSELKDVTQKFGQCINSSQNKTEYWLYFSGFRRAINTGALPAPV